MKDYKIIWKDGLWDCEDFEGLQNISNDDFLGSQNKLWISRDYEGVRRLQSFLSSIVKLFNKSFYCIVWIIYCRRDLLLGVFKIITSRINFLNKVVKVCKIIEEKFF